jgi:hypothetical protein
MGGRATEAGLATGCVTSALTSMGLVKSVKFKPSRLYSKRLILYGPLAAGSTGMVGAFGRLMLPPTTKELLTGDMIGLAAPDRLLVVLVAAAPCCSATTSILHPDDQTCKLSPPSTRRRS